MATLFRLKKEGDKRAHTCDARCYNAKGTECKCFCKGENHGKGFAFALNNCIANVEKFKVMGCEMGKTLIEAIAKTVKELGGNNGDRRD